MKKVVLMMILFLAIGCGSSMDEIKDSLDPPPIVVDPPIPDPEPDPDPEPPVTQEKIKFCIMVGDTLKFWDGTELKDWKSGVIRKAGNKLFTVGDILYELGEYGETLSTTQLPAVAQQCIKVGDDIWTFENIDPMDAYNLGALYKDYTRTYKNYDEQGEVWYMNKYKSKYIYKDNSDNIFVKDEFGPTISVNNNLEDVRIIIPDGFTIYEFDNLQVNFEYNNNTYTETFYTNYMYSAKYWLKSGNIWYSQNGYEWTEGGGLIENANCLWEWNSYPYPVQDIYGEAPFIISAGTRVENSETVFYYIECNTGWLMKYIPSINQLTQKIKLYYSNGTRQSGILFSKNLKQKLINNALFFCDQGNIYRYDFNTNLVSIFYAGDGKILEF